VVAQQESLSADLKAAALRDAACTKAADTPEKDPTLEALPIRTGSREVGTIVEVQARATARQRIATRWFISEAAMATGLALHEKYASLHRDEDRQTRDAFTLQGSLKSAR